MNDSDSAWALLALRSAPGSPGDAIARLDARNFEYIVRQKKIIIGRRTSREKIDVNMGHSNFISRHHLEIHYQAPNFYMKCISKNGIFVDGLFVRNDAEPILLPKQCTFRFPSTTIKLAFQSLINEEPIDLKLAQVGGFKPPTQSPQPVKETCDFRSQPQSPADTISAANSCPTSPRPSTKWHKSSRTQPNSPQSQAQHLNHTGYVEVLDQSFMDASEVILDTNGNSTLPSSVDGSNHHSMLMGNSQSGLICDQKPTFSHEPSTSSSNSRHGDDGKPPYSYAQLIVQAISAANDKQLTLNGIYSYITRNYPYYKTADKGWQNSIRHNLSLNRYFVKVPRNQEEPGKGSFWRIETMNETKLLDQAYRRRRKRENSNNSSQPATDGLNRCGEDSKTPDLTMKQEPEQIKTEEVTEEAIVESVVASQSHLDGEPQRVELVQLQNSTEIIGTSLETIDELARETVEDQPVLTELPQSIETLPTDQTQQLSEVVVKTEMSANCEINNGGDQLEAPTTDVVEDNIVSQIVKEEIVQTEESKDCGTSN